MDPPPPIHLRSTFQIHNIAENNVGMMRRVVLSGHTGAQANLMGEYKLQVQGY